VGISKPTKYVFFRNLLDVFYIWKQEFLNIFRESGILIIFFIAPLSYPILYGVVYNNEVLHDVSIAVVDLSKKSQSRYYIRALDATPELNVAYLSHSLEEAKLLFYEQKVHGIVLVSADFDANIVQGKQASVSAYFDMSSFLYYKTMMTAVSIVSKDVGAQIQYTNLINSGLTEQEARIATNPMPYNSVPMFNSGGGFSSFLLPVIFILILYQTLMLGISMLSGVYWEENEYKRLIPFNKRYHGTLRIVFGKALCYFSLYAVLTFYMLGFMPYVFNLPHVGSPGALLVFMIPFLLATIFLAMTFSVVMRNMESAFLLLLFMTLPLLFLAGVSWPQSNMPVFWKFVSYLFPSTHGIQGYVRINTMGAGLNEVGFEYFVLWLQVGVYFLTACLSYNRQIKLSGLRK